MHQLKWTVPGTSLAYKHYLMDIKKKIWKRVEWRSEKLRSLSTDQTCEEAKSYQQKEPPTVKNRHQIGKIRITVNSSRSLPSFLLSLTHTINLIWIPIPNYLTRREKQEYFIFYDRKNSTSCHNSSSPRMYDICLIS